MLAVGADPVAGAQVAGGDALESVHQPGDGDLWRVGDQQVEVVVVAVHLDQRGAEVGAQLGEHLPHGVQVLVGQHPAPILGYEDQMYAEGRGNVPALAVVVVLSYRPSMFGGMLVRYRYRLDLTPGQRQALARAFGCARVVYNDALRARQDAYAAGERLSDTEVQRRVVTLAKRTPERAWLGEVASVVLVQACQDARRAWRNWFDSLSGKRRGRRVGHPRFRTKHGHQSIRLTRNGFTLHETRLYVAKVGDLKVRWSRPLPSPPSSVTIIREPDGRCYASFVVERSPALLPPIDRTAGVDLGLGAFAAVAASDGTTELVPNLRYLRAAERRLARAQRRMARKRKGSANRAKARHRVAVAHRKVRDRRADHHHKLALRLVRENQAVAVEDLAVAGLARTRLAKSVHDAGWAMFVRRLEGKAAQYGRRVVKVGRWEPTSQTCSGCGHRDGPKPLGVRTWACQACGVVHDRDLNAARNILKLLVAAGLAETQNACGAGVSPPAMAAVGNEAGTHRGAA
jgi:putative transposase